MISRFLLCILLIAISSATLSAKKNPEKKKRGTVTVYYNNSKQVWYTGQNKNFLKEGTWTYYAPDGKITHTDNYKAGVLNGERKVFMKDKASAIETFINGKPHGPQHYYYESGELKSSLYFTAGNIDSARFWSDGGLIYVRVEIYTNRQVTEKRYYYRGYLKSTEYYENGKKVGVWKTYSGYANDTTVITFFTYKGGQRNGFSRESGFRNDALEAWYINDTLNGPFKYIVDKKVQKEGAFKNGELHGVCKTYLTGQFIEETNYINGHETGVSKVYSEIDGHIISKRYFSDKVTNRRKALVDSAFSYNQQGKKTREDIWLRQVNPAYPQTEYHLFREWFDDGKLKQRGHYSENWNQYILTEYYANGKLKSIKRFV
ncbi:MAG: hypothetical protein ACRC3B_14595, partial [Bacteroidia bacterium]